MSQVLSRHSYEGVNAVPRCLCEWVGNPAQTELEAHDEWLEHVGREVETGKRDRRTIQVRHLLPGARRFEDLLERRGGGIEFDTRDGDRGVAEHDNSEGWRVWLYQRE